MAKIYGYTVVSYPESMPSDWKIKLNYLPFGYAYCLHNMDVDEETGEKKKEHIHFFFQGVATKKQKEYIHDSLCIGYGENIHSASGMYDYLTHENNPDKYHYSKDSIVYSEKWSQEIFDTYYTKSIKKGDIMQYIYSNRVSGYHKLLDSLLRDGKEDWLDYCTNHIWVRNYVNDIRYSKDSVKGQGEADTP